MMRLNLQLFATDINKLSYGAMNQIAKQIGITNYSGTTEEKNKINNYLNGGSTSGGVSKGETLEYKKGQAATMTTLPYSGGTPEMTQLGIKGVDQGTTDKMNSTFTVSDSTKKAQSSADSMLGNLQDKAKQTNIINQSTWDILNSTYQTPTAVTEAFNYTNSLLEQLSSGRTSYTDRINALMNDIQNREDFSYDVDSDTLFQQSLASAMASGKTAMQDTIGQASALTGGYGSTYATSAANQTYNAYIQDAYANLPEYYQMAMEAYQMEGDEMYKQLAMLNDADANEYQRLYNSWSANFTTAQQMYQNSYGEWQDSVNNAYNSANLQLNESSQLYKQAYDAYIATSNDAQQKYQNEYNKWADEVNNAYKTAQMMNSDYWSNAELTQRQNEFNAEMGYKQQALAQDQSQFVSRYDLNGDGVVDSKDSALEYSRSVSSSSSGSSKSSSSSSKSGSATSGVKAPSETQMKKALEAYNSGGDEALYQYVDSLGSDIDMDAIDSYVSQYGQLPLEKRTFTKTKDTFNWFGGVDGNDIVKDQYGNEYRIDQLPESIRKSVSKLKVNESYTAK